MWMHFSFGGCLWNMKRCFLRPATLNLQLILWPKQVLNFWILLLSWSNMPRSPSPSLELNLRLEQRHVLLWIQCCWWILFLLINKSKIWLSNKKCESLLTFTHHDFTTCLGFHPLLYNLSFVNMLTNSMSSVCFLSEHFIVCRDMWSIVFVLDVVVGRGLFPRVLCMGSPQTRVLLNWSFSAARGQLQRNELVVSWVVSGFWIHTGWTRFVAYSFIYHFAVV